MRLLICGTRNWPGAWEDIGIHIPENDTDVIVHGACSNVVDGIQVSVDMLVDFIANGLGIPVERYPVDRAIDGPRPGAGPRRNARMLRDSKPDRGMAFGPLFTWREFSGDRKKKHGDGAGFWKQSGTGDMVQRMLRAGLSVCWIASPNAPPVDLIKMPEPQ